MLLKANDTEDFSLTMRIRIDWDLQYIEVSVTLCNKKKHTATVKTFPAAEFMKALVYYEQQEKMFL